MLPAAVSGERRIETAPNYATGQALTVLASALPRTRPCASDRFGLGADDLLGKGAESRGQLL